MSELGQEICSAIDIIVQKRLSELLFDKTIQGVVIECLNPLIGEYKVKYQDSKILAYSTDPKSILYQKGDTVYLSVPFNDLSSRKTILGSVSGDQKEHIALTWTGNCIPDLNNFTAIQWESDILKEFHIGDSYINTETNTRYIFNKVFIEYSADSENWHLSFQEGDLYVRKSKDNKNTWTIVQIGNEDSSFYEYFQWQRL